MLSEFIAVESGSLQRAEKESGGNLPVIEHSRMLGQEPIYPELVSPQGFHDLQMVQLVPLLSKVHLQAQQLFSGQHKKSNVGGEREDVCQRSPCPHKLMNSLQLRAEERDPQPHRDYQERLSATAEE